MIGYAKRNVLLGVKKLQCATRRIKLTFPRQLIVVRSGFVSRRTGDKECGPCTVTQDTRTPVRRSHLPHHSVRSAGLPFSPADRCVSSMLSCVFSRVGYCAQAYVWPTKLAHAMPWLALSFKGSRMMRVQSSWKRSPTVADR